MDIQVGNIMVVDWGATMTLPTFYKVKKRTAKRAVLTEIKSKNVDGDGMIGHSIPFDEPVERSCFGDLNIVIRDDGNGWCAKHSKIARPWDGTPERYDHWD